MAVPTAAHHVRNEPGDYDWKSDRRHSDQRSCSSTPTTGTKPWQRTGPSAPWLGVTLEQWFCSRRRHQGLGPPPTAAVPGARPPDNSRGSGEAVSPELQAVRSVRDIRKHDAASIGPRRRPPSTIVVVDMTGDAEGQPPLAVPASSGNTSAFAQTAISTGLWTKTYTSSMTRVAPRQRR